MPIIARNNTQNRILIDDLGVFIDATSSVQLTGVNGTFEKETVASSEDLLARVITGDISISDGIEFLSIVDGVKHVTIQTEWEDEEIIPPHTLSQHSNVIGTAPTDQSQMYYDSTAALWIIKNKEISSGTTPPEDPTHGELWFPENAGNLPWMWNGTQWITIYRTHMTFSKGGNCDGEYITIGGWVAADFYWFSGYGKICAIYSRSLSGYDTKEFFLRDARTDPPTDLYSFSYPGGGVLEYKDLSMGVPIDKDTLLKCFVSKDGSFITDVLVQIEIAWRYVE